MNSYICFYCNKHEKAKKLPKKWKQDTFMSKSENKLVTIFICPKHIK